MTFTPRLYMSLGFTVYLGIVLSLHGRVVIVDPATKIAITTLIVVELSAVLTEARYGSHARAVPYLWTSTVLVGLLVFGLLLAHDGAFR